MRGEISSSHPIERKAGPLPARRSHHPAPFLVPTPVLFIAQSSRFGAFTLLIVAAVNFLIAGPLYTNRTSIEYESLSESDRLH